MSNANDFVVEKNILKRYTGKDPYVEVPDGVKSIDSYAFQRNANIRAVRLPDSVTKINDTILSVRSSMLHEFWQAASHTHIGLASLGSCCR